MAAGLPFVSTDVGGVRDLAAGECVSLPSEYGIKAGNGYMTARTADALLYAIRELTANTARTRAMGARGRQFVRERFAAGRLVDEMRDLYLELLGLRAATEMNPDRTAQPAALLSTSRPVD
jgi:glycosyltransferase involved in cell wall biosynthesis